ncbi:phage tail tube protein [Halalkalibacterium halodurans]|uniref:phage tail tube protein n=1 Tax=Halalkalibacterium halodurans TaxID=86665 RepID=UPI002E1D5AC4|nr:phage tail tube protein [Halalkalibacterium halodurans]
MIRRYLKIGEESQYGEEASEYPETLDPESASLEPEADDKMIYEGMSGIDRLAKLGVYSTSGSITLPLDDKATGWFWKWALGGYEVTGTDDGEGNVSAPYTHVFSPSREPLMKSFTARIGKDIMEHVFLGNVIESIELECDSEWALMTINTVGAKDKRSSLVDSVDFTEGNVFTAPMASLEKNGIDISPSVGALSLSLETGADIESSQGFGSRFPTKAFTGSMVVTVELTLGFDSADELIAFWGGSDGPSTENIEEFEYIIHFGSDLDFIFPRLVYTAASQPAEGRDGIEQTVTARALYHQGTKTGPILVSLTNDKESY